MQNLNCVKGAITSMLCYFRSDPKRLPCNAALLKLVCVRVNEYIPKVCSLAHNNACTDGIMLRAYCWLDNTWFERAQCIITCVKVHVHAVSVKTGENNDWFWQNGFSSNTWYWCIWIQCRSGTFKIIDSFQYQDLAMHQFYIVFFG